MGEGQGMTQRDQLAGFFRRENPGQPCRSQDISFGDGPALYETEGRFLQTDFSARHCFPEHDRFGRNVHHGGFPSGVDVGKPFHADEVFGVTESFHSFTTARICSAALSLGLTCFRLYQGNMPSKSGVTRICPSQSGPDPIPIVGMAIRWLISRAARGATSSRTMAKAPASASASASASKVCCSGALFPLTR